MISRKMLILFRSNAKYIYCTAMRIFCRHVSTPNLTQLKSIHSSTLTYTLPSVIFHGQW